MTVEHAVSGVLDLLEKSAAEADQLEQTVKAQALEIAELKRQPKVASAPQLDMTALEKMAHTLEEEQLLPEGLNAKSACEQIVRNPNILVRWLHTLSSPPRETEGRAVKSATAETKPISGGGKLVRIGDSTVVDRDGWAAVLEG